MSEERDYEPFDQEKWLPEPPYRTDDAALVAWEAAHGHDVRLKCYVEFGCMVIEPTLEREIASLRSRLSQAEAVVEAARELEDLFGLNTPLVLQRALAAYDTPTPESGR